MIPTYKPKADHIGTIAHEWTSHGWLPFYSPIFRPDLAVEERPIKDIVCDGDGDLMTDFIPEGQRYDFMEQSSEEDSGAELQRVLYGVKKTEAKAIRKLKKRLA